MKYPTILALSSILVACGSCVPRSVPDSPNTLEPQTVAKLQILKENGEKNGSCTVWKASPTLAVTAGHCCKSDNYYTIHGAPAIEGAPVSVLVDNDTWDVCVLHARMDGPIIPIAAQDPAIGARVWTAGYPHGVYVITDGYWSGRDGDNQGTTSIVAAGGASGSPIMDTNGRAVGVLVSGYRGAPVTFGVPIESLRRALAQARQLDKPED